MKFGDQARITVTGVDKKGRGTGTVNGKPFAVPFAIPGEEALATVTKRDGSNLRMRLDEVLMASPDRVQPKCAYAGKCGGCAWQQFSYPRQLAMKLAHVNGALGTIGLAVEEVQAAPALYHYRNRMDYCVGWQGQVGLKEPGRWNGYVDIDDCLLLSPDAMKVMAAFKAWMKTSGAEPWDAKFGRGFLRYLVIREGKRTGQRMVTIVTARGVLPEREALIAALSPFATTIYHGINPTITDLSIASELELLHGDPHLTEEVDGQTFAIPPNAFFQTNTAMAEQLVRTAREFLGSERPRVLLDLYCGTGLFGICLADSAERVVGVEMEASAIAVAQGNAERNGVTNVRYVAAKAEEIAHWQDERPDTVIVDPPRSGLHPRVCEQLIAIGAPRMVYVSCNVETFVRDMATLGTAYTVSRVAALDLFPHSPHAETIALLVKK